MGVINYLAWTGVTVLLIPAIIFQVQIPLSVIESESSISAETVSGENYKMGAILYMANDEGEFGEISEDRVEELNGVQDRYCVFDKPGFDNSLGLSYKEYVENEEGCQEPVRPIKAPIYVTDESGISDIRVLGVGGTN